MLMNKIKLTMNEIYNWFRNRQEYESLRQQEAEMTFRRNWERTLWWINKEREKSQKSMDEFTKKIKCKSCGGLSVFMREKEICYPCYYNPPKTSWHK